MSTSPPDRLRGLRGATTVARNGAVDIVAASAELLTELLERNGLRPADVVSIVFTATQDLNAAFPASAARTVGLDKVPVLSASELDVPGAVGGCVRVLMHVYPARPDEELHPVYLHGAVRLRTDLGE